VVGLVEAAEEVVPEGRMSALETTAPDTTGARAPVVEVRGISKRFGAVQALTDVSVAFAAGEVHGLVGENGAGKSTLTKIIAGAQRPDAGELLVDGAPIDPSTPADALAAGVVVIYQELSLIPELSVAANVFLGHELRRGRMLDERAMRRRTAELLEQLGARFSPDRLAGELSVADQQLAEIARALNRRSRLIIMDEPTAALPAEAHEHLFDVVRRLRAQGTAVVYISHELADVFALCDRITVMKDGRRVATTATADTDRDQVIRGMVGRTLGELFPPRRTPPPRAATPALRVRGLTLPDHFADVDLHIERGEILGLAGLVGSGRTSLARALFGSPPGVGGCRAVRGTVEVDGRPVKVRGVGDAIRAGLAYVPEERKTDGLALELSIEENIALPQLRQLARHGLTRRGAQQRAAAEQIDALRIRTPSAATPAGALSGGNQQKIVLGKWLARGCGILLLDEPTRGIDVGAKVEIYRLLRSLTEEGLAILLISSDMPEVLGLSDRVAVMRRGRLVKTFDHANVTEEAVIRLALGAEEVSHVDAG
jgi:rhamnose transport system ATP-binding protein